MREHTLMESRREMGEMSVTLLSGLPEANFGDSGLVPLKYVWLWNGTVFVLCVSRATLSPSA